MLGAFKYVDLDAMSLGSQRNFLTQFLFQNPYISFS